MDLMIIQFILWIYIPHAWEHEGIEATNGWFSWRGYETYEECMKGLVEFITEKGTPAECHKSLLMPTIHGTRPTGKIGEIIGENIKRLK